MRIAIDGMLLRPPYSGVEVAIENTVRSVATEAPGWEFVVFVPPDFVSQETMPDNVVLRYAPGWTRLRIGRVLWEQLALPRLLRREDIDLLHAPGYVMPLLWRGATVLSVYDLFALTHPQWCKFWNVAHFHLLLEHSAERAARVIVPSEHVSRQLVSVLGADSRGIRVVPLGVAPVFHALKETTFGAAFLQQVRNKYDLPKEYLLSVGNLRPRKNVEGTVSLFERLSEAIPHDLVCVGAKPYRQKRILQRIERSPVRDRIHLVGHVPRDELLVLYNAADVCLHLAHYEGFGLVPLEAMACGVPVVICGEGALPEVAGPGAVAVDAADGQEAAQAVIRLLTDEAYRDEQIARGCQHAAKFTWLLAAQQTVAVYRQVVGEHG